MASWLDYRVALLFVKGKPELFKERLGRVWLALSFSFNSTSKIKHGKVKCARDVWVDFLI